MKNSFTKLSGVGLAFLLLTSFSGLESKAGGFSSKFRSFKSKLNQKINNLADSETTNTTNTNTHYYQKNNYNSSTNVNSTNNNDNNTAEISNRVIIEPEMSRLRRPTQIEAQIDQMVIAKWQKPASVDQDNWQRILTGVKQASKQTGIPQQLIMSVINKESAFNSSAMSRTGAIGLMQLMPSTALSECQMSASDLYNIELNIKCGTSYLDKQIKYFKKVDLALAAYNAGPGAVRRAVEKAQTSDIETVTSLLKPETAPYVRKILANINYGEDFL